MNIGDRVRFERRALGPWDTQPATTGMVIGFQGPLLIVEVDDPERSTIVGPPHKFRRVNELRSIQAPER